MNYDKTYRRAIREIRRSLSPIKKTHKSPKRVVISVSVVAVGALAVAMVTALPKQADARDLDRIVDALGVVQTYHMTLHSGGKGISFERWQAGKRMRYRIGTANNYEIDRAFDGKRVWAIMFDQRSANIHTEEPSAFGLDGAPTIEKTINEFRRFREASQTIKQTKTGDRTEIVLETKNKKSRVRILADSNRHWPYQIDYQYLSKDGTWASQTKSVFEYPDKLSDDVFTFNPPQGFAVYDNDKTMATLRLGLESGSPKTVKGVTIRLAGAIQDERGAIYVIWSGGGVPPLFAKAAASDSTGKPIKADIIFEGDDRARPKNHGIAPKIPLPKIPFDKQVRILRPLGLYQGKPFYALRVQGALREQNTPQTLKVVLPICKPVELYIQQPSGWIKSQATAKQVGTAEFTLVTTPVESCSRFVKWIDPNLMPTLDTSPIEHFGLSTEQKRRLQIDSLEISRNWIRRNREVSERMFSK